MSATIHPIATGRAPSLDAMIALVAADMNGVNAVILERMQSKVSLIPELAGHLIAGGGKRMRPMLTLACANLLGYPGTRHHKLAAAVEFIHTATLLHDDVVDGSGMRRGKQTANLIWGNPASVLVGDFLFSRAFELMVEDGSLKVLRILSHASAVIAEGEVEQLTAQRQIDTDEDHYLDIISAKTAALFAAACRVAPVVAEADEDVELALESYGRNLGIAFQLTDDVIDYASDAETMGKGVGDDFRDGKMTLPVILAYARRAKATAPSGASAIGGDRVSDEDLAERSTCCAAAARSTIRSNARGCMAVAPSTRSPCSPRARPRRPCRGRRVRRRPRLLSGRAHRHHQVRVRRTRPHHVRRRRVGLGARRIAGENVLRARRP